MKIKTLVIFFLFAILLAACSGPSSPPWINLNVDGTAVSGFQSPYCWDSGLGDTFCADPPYPPPFLEEPAHQVSMPLQLELDSPLPQSVNLSLSAELFGDNIVAEDVDVNSNIEWSPNVPPGEYILSVNAVWKQGEVGYWFLISIP